jgi:hypothetical protein
MRTAIAVAVLLGGAALLAHAQKEGRPAPLTFHGRPVREINCWPNNQRDAVQLDCQLNDNDGKLNITLIPRYEPSK